LIDGLRSPPGRGECGDIANERGDSQERGCRELHSVKILEKETLPSSKQ
jgi:hypothetical protein